MPASATKAKLLALTERLIAEGHRVINGPKPPIRLLPADAMAKFRAGCRNLLRVLGPNADPWRSAFDSDSNHEQAAAKMLGTLHAIKEAIDADLLVTVEDLVFAEAFADLFEQADHLLTAGYHVAAGVLGRGVLEEHLRKWCDRAGCPPVKPKGKPTIADYADALAKASHLNKLDRHHVTAMAAVGNECAHNTGNASPADVERFLRDVRAFLAAHPLA